MKSHHTWTVLLVAVLSLPRVSLAGGGDPATDEEYARRMAAEHTADSPTASGAATADPAAAVEETEVSYATVDGKPVRGFLARPAAGADKAPAIIVIHEWWGLNDNIRSMARRLAGEGYTALAVDLYAGRVAEDPQDARRYMGETMEQPGNAEDNLRQAYRYLTSELGASRAGVIGWCFGGGWSLRTALLLPTEIDATVIYYGRLVTDRDQLATLDAPVLGIFGGADQGIPVDTVRQFESALESLDKEASIHVYDGAGHAFANPSGTRYVAAAAEDAWKKTLDFFEENLQP